MCAKLLNWRGNLNFHDWGPDHLCARADQSCVNQRPHMREQADHLCVDNRNYPQVGVRVYGRALRGTLGDDLWSTK